MGTDIHVFVEKKNEQGKWECVTPLPYPHGVGDEDHYPYRKDYSDRVEGPWGYYNGYGDEPNYRTLRNWFNDRNYNLFGMLADVRNGRGFAGVFTGEPFDVLKEPCGWPEDLSPELQEEKGKIEHTPSWITVKEWEDYSAKVTGEFHTEAGVVSATEFLKHEGERPSTWCGGISGPGIRTITPAQFKFLQDLELLHTSEETVGSTYHENHYYVENVSGEKIALFVNASWKAHYEDSFGRWPQLIEELKTLGDPEDVRLLFYFDS